MITQLELRRAATDIKNTFSAAIEVMRCSNPELEKFIKNSINQANKKEIKKLQKKTIQVFEEIINKPEASTLITSKRVEEIYGEDGCPVFGKAFEPVAPECVECARAIECAPLTRLHRGAESSKTHGRGNKEETIVYRNKKKYGRIDAVCEVFYEAFVVNADKIITKKELLKRVDGKYSAVGGTLRSDKNMWLIRICLRPMIAMGVIEDTKEGYKFIGPEK